MRSRRPSPRALIILAIVALAAVVSVPLLASWRASATASTGGAAAGQAGAPLAASTSPAASPGILVPPVLPTPEPPVQAAWRVAFEWHVPVLMYHVIAAPSAAGDALPGLVVAPDLFAAQLAAARAAGWSTITAAALARDMAAGTPPPPRTFVITIDDGHEDGYTQAFPILREDGFVATFYVPTERIGHPGDLTQSEILTLAAAGMEIADHTVDHVPLASVPPSDATYEIDSSATALGQLLGARPTTFAYPFGSHDPSVMAEVGQAGFLLALTTAEGCSESIANRLEAPRMRVGPDTTPQLLLSKLDGCAARPAWG